MDATEFIDNFVAHAYDPVKAHEYYVRTRKLKGKATAAEKAGAAAYEQHQTADAKTRLASDLKKTPVVMNKKRRISAAEQKLIRAKSLANRIKDPTVKAEMLKKLAATEKKLLKVKGKTAPSGTIKPVKPGTPVRPAAPVARRK